MKIEAAMRIQSRKVTAADEVDAGEALKWLTKIFGAPKKVKRDAVKHAEENPGDYQEVEWDNDMFVGNLTLSPGSGGLSLLGHVKGGKDQTSDDINASGQSFVKFKKDLASEAKLILKNVGYEMEDAQVTVDNCKAFIKTLNKLI